MTSARIHARDLTFPAGRQVLAGTRIQPADLRAPELLHLHGLGPTASRHTVRYLLEPLVEHGYGALTFEYSGNGGSTGVLRESTLRVRRGETLAAAALLDPATAPVLIGTSMGAHLAASTVAEVRPRALILFCPAAYPASMLDSRLDGTQAKPGSYPDSPAFAGIAGFTGDLLIVAARDDEVVRPPVVESYLEHATAARSVRTVWVEGSGHFIHRWLPDQPATRAAVLAEMLRVVQAGATEIRTPAERETEHVR